MIVVIIQAALAIFKNELVPPCLFHELTGYPCPSCGSTRAFRCLLLGDPIEAISFNPLVVIGGTLLLAYIAFGLIVKMRYGTFPEPAWTPRRIRSLQISAVTLLIVNWAYLISMGI